MKRIQHRSIQIIEATTPLDNLWESVALQEILKMEGIWPVVTGIRLGWKTGFLAHLNNARARFIHVCAHGDREGLLLGLFNRKVYPNDYSRITGALRGRVMILSACFVSKHRSQAWESIRALQCDCLITPAADIAFSDAAMFYLTFYWRLFSYRYADCLRNRDPSRLLLKKVTNAYAHAGRMTGLKNQFRLYQPIWRSIS